MGSVFKFRLKLILRITYFSGRPPAPMIGSPSLHNHLNLENVRE